MVSIVAGGWQQVFWEFRDEDNIQQFRFSSIEGDDVRVTIVPRERAHPEGL
jgi:hypothetical protein